MQRQIDSYSRLLNESKADKEGRLKLTHAEIADAQRSAFTITKRRQGREQYITSQLSKFEMESTFKNQQELKSANSQHREVLEDRNINLTKIKSAVRGFMKDQLTEMAIQTEEVQFKETEISLASKRLTT